MSFATNINRICFERGTTLTAIVKAVKGSTSFVTAINKGSLPKESEIIQMAQLLHCSVTDFFLDEEDPAIRDSLQNSPQDEDEEDILRIFRSLSRRAKHEFMILVYEFESKHELEKNNGVSASVENNPDKTA